jgi:alkylhydroperoxidase family enzyme
VSTNAAAASRREDAVCSLERHAEAENLSAAERSALRFAELFTTDHLAIDDAVYDELREHFSEDELVELGLNCAIALGVGRLSVIATGSPLANPSLKARCAHRNGSR